VQVEGSRVLFAAILGFEREVRWRPEEEYVGRRPGGAERSWNMLSM